MQQGFAKQAFLTRHQKTPWKEAPSTPHPWPILYHYYLQGRITYLDYVLTKRMLQNGSQEAALFICHLILAAREGHLCVEATSHHINPTVRQLWQQDECPPLTLKEEKHLETLILKGSQESLPSICRYQDCFYLQRHWFFESLLLEHLKRHLATPSAIQIDHEKVKQDLQELPHILPEQAQAIYNGCVYPLSLISGGPGTGKTYTAGQLIKIFCQNLKQPCEIALAAPTGKAVANLQARLENLTAKTLHLLLGIKGSRSQLTADLILVDESSMIDIRLMAYLFEAIKPGAHLILLGDPHQLPSIEAGNAFADLIALPNIPHVHLKTCLRAELQSIIDFAAMINQGEVNNIPQAGIRRFDIPSDPKLFVRETAHLFPTQFKHPPDDRTLLSLFQTTRILSPMRKGPFGVDSINTLFEKHLSTTSEWMAIPILITANSYSQDLFNGETGVLMRCGQNAYAIFPSRSNQEPRRLPASLLPKYEYAYCLSVHKSQGSEFDHIILLLPEGSELFGRELLYTAVTRARKQIDIYGSQATLTKIAAQKGMRLSGIRQRMKFIHKQHE